MTSGTAGSNRLTSQDVTGYLVAEQGIDATPADVVAVLGPEARARQAVLAAIKALNLEAA